MINIKKWQMVLAFIVACFGIAAKAAEYLDSRIDERVQTVAVPRSDFDRLETKLDRITELLIKPRR